MKKLMNLCNMSFERAMRECLEKSLLNLGSQFDKFIELLETALMSKIPSDLEVDHFAGVYRNVDDFKPVKSRPTIKCKLKFTSSFSLNPTSEQCIETILDAVLSSFDD